MGRIETLILELSELEVQKQIVWVEYEQFLDNLNKNIEILKNDTNAKRIFERNFREKCFKYNLLLMEIEDKHFEIFKALKKEKKPYTNDIFR